MKVNCIERFNVTKDGNLGGLEFATLSAVHVLQMFAKFSSLLQKLTKSSTCI